MKTRNRLISKTLVITMLTVLAAGLICLPRLQSYASGTINVKLSDIDGLDTTGFDGFTFRLYRVGSYDGPDFILEPDYSDVNVRIPSKEEYDKNMQEGDPTWEQAWLDSAAALAKHIEHPAEGSDAPEPVATFENRMPGDTMTYYSDENALFLLIGSTERVDNQNWKPVPMFVRTLNGEESYTIDGSLKVEVSPVVFEFSLGKIWEGDDNNEAGLRPEYIDVAIYYGNDLIDTVQLGDGVWTYSWKSEETGDTYYYIHDVDGKEVRTPFTPSDKEAAWDIKEIVTEDEMVHDGARSEYPHLRFYTPTYKSVSGEDMIAFTVTNTLVYKSLELTKNIDGYDADVQNVTFSFKVEGRENAEDAEPIYTNHIGITFSNDDDLSKTVRLDYIPVDVTDIRIIEEYSGNYEMDGEPQITFDEENNIWKITVNNKHDGHGPKGGVVNKYEHGKEPVQEG